DVDEAPREVLLGERHRVLGDLEVEPVARDEVVDHVPLGLTAAVELDDSAAVEDEARRRVVRPVEGDETELGARADEQLAAQLAALAREEPPGAPGFLAHRAARRPRSA